MSLAPPFSAARRADPFGDWPQWRRDMGLGPHRGMDWNGLPAGTAIPASGSGVCTAEGWSDALGWWAVIRYTVDGSDVYFGYCHMQDRTHLRYGVWVATGDRVGRVGNTGTASTGTHLHLTASRQNGNPGVVPVINPADFLTDAAPAGGGYTPITNTEESDMSISFVKDAQSATIFVCSVDNGRRRGIASPYHMQLLQRFRKNDGGDPMLQAELDVVRGYLASFEEGNDSEKIIAAIKAQAITPAAVRDAIKAAVSEGIGITVDAKVSDAQLDAAAERFAKLLGIRIAGGDLAGA